MIDIAAFEICTTQNKLRHRPLFEAKSASSALAVLLEVGCVGMRFCLAERKLVL